MREIIHIQAGLLSNYTGTHYWNTQEDYFVYDEDDNSIVDYNVSFKEGRDEHNQPTLYPRLLAFDQKSNFGTLTRGLHEEVAQTWQTVWHGGVVRQEQGRIPRSEYHSLLESEDNAEQAEPIAAKIRYWSDFSRVFYDSKSIQVIPDQPDFTDGDWKAGCENFLRYDDDAELMDGSLRLLVEECDNFQGLQMIQDTSNFGGFSSSLLSAFRDEYPKATIMTFACLSNTDLGDSSQIKQVLNDALSLQRAVEFCDLTIPILPPPLWGSDCWFSGCDIDYKSPYQTSAILSAHIENATLPLRLQGGLDNLQTMVAHLNWRKSSPFALLRGTLCPQGLFTESLGELGNLSFYTNGQPLFARRDVSRGLSQYDLEAYDAWSKVYELKASLTWRHLPSYPIPTSFAPIFPESRPKALKMISSLSTSSSTRGYLSSYAHFVETAAARRDNTLLAMGLEGDEVRELVSALWDIVDGYGESEDVGDYTSEGDGE